MTAAFLGCLSTIGVTLGFVLFVVNCLKAASNLTNRHTKGDER